MEKLGQCEMCGNEGNLFKISIEGTELNVCKNCTKHGKVIKGLRREKPMSKKIIIEKKLAEKEIFQVIVENYWKQVKEKREKLGITQKDLAKKLNEKESIIHKIESAHFKPSIKLAEKIERFLGIKIIDEYEEETKKEYKKTSSNALTIGDTIKVKFK